MFLLDQTFSGYKLAQLSLISDPAYHTSQLQMHKQYSYRFYYTSFSYEKVLYKSVVLNIIKTVLKNIPTMTCFYKTAIKCHKKM